MVAGVVPIIREYPFRFLHAKVADSFPVEKRAISMEADKALEMWVPIEGKRCGNSELPCNPYMTLVLMRDFNDISKGFELKR